MLFAVDFDKNIFEYPVSLNFCILPLFLVYGPQALYVNPGYFKWTSGINKNVFAISFFID